jgi:hypothetical protein
MFENTSTPGANNSLAGALQPNVNVLNDIAAP